MFSPPSSSSLNDAEWELLDPCPDIHALFVQYNDTYFWGTLMGCEVKWSPRMTLCAGICCYEGRGGLCSIKLSGPLLKLRPRRDLVETLLHEMIHAYLFVSQHDRDRDGHGPNFQSHMHRINAKAGVNITIYHSFHAEVNEMRKHWWKCQGPCKDRHPYYGIVKRSMNRPPGPSDTWHANHESTCGGTYLKIKEPQGFKAQSNHKKRKIEQEKNAVPKPNSTQTINKFFGAIEKTTNSSNCDSISNAFVPFSGEGHVLNSNHTVKAMKLTPTLSSKAQYPKAQFTKAQDPKAQFTKAQDPKAQFTKAQDPKAQFTKAQDPKVDSPKAKCPKSQPLVTVKDEPEFVCCPVCSTKVAKNIINIHLDSCLN